MALSDEKIREYTGRLLKSRMRILCNHGFYGLLLMHMVFSVDENLKTASTDGIRITFGTDFLATLSDNELDFVMMHEILHVVLQHCFRSVGFEDNRFNIACDIVVNSNILLENNMDLSSITLNMYGESMHKAPDGNEGHNYTVEQVYNMLTVAMRKGKSGDSEGEGAGKAGDKGVDREKGNGEWGKKWDDHSHWGREEEKDILKDIWTKRLKDACEAIRIKDPANERGLLPAFAERIVGELHKSQTDWRIILNEFVQEELTDYSFMPPDRRFDDNPFFLPDFNEKDDKVEKLLFMIDTSGSISDNMITAAYSEIKGAIDQFDGKLSGWLGFFDAAVIKPKPFENQEELRIMKPRGGGGTNFYEVFKYVQDNMQDELPVSIIILSDGYAPFPKESMAMGIPVLWILNNEDVNPPWGRVARIKI